MVASKVRLAAGGLTLNGFRQSVVLNVDLDLGVYLKPQTEVCATLPAMIGGMARLDRDKRAATSGANLVVSNQFTFDDCPVIG